MHYIASIGSKELLTKVFESENAGKVDLNKKDFNKNTPLLTSIENLHEDFAIVLVEMGANLTIQGQYGQTPLLLACEKGLVKLVTKIAEINPKLIADTNMFGENCIGICHRNKNEELSHYLIQLSNSANVEVRPLSKVVKKKTSIN